MRGGLGPVSVVSACVGAVLVWTMAAHDPYWRLFEMNSLPAPDYESPAEIEAALAAASVPVHVPDSMAVRPSDVTGAGKPGGDRPRIALLPRPAEPVIAVPVAVSLAESSDPAGDAPPPPEAPAGSAPLVVAAPPSPVRPELAEAPGIANSSAPGEIFAAGAPAPLWVAADEASEAELALTRRQRVDVQRRLALAGFDPGSFDGVFGPRTRQAITDFQAAWGFPATGYLDSAVRADLGARTEEAYAALASRAAREPRAAPKLAPVARERQLAINETDRCARDSNGRIVERQSLGCDLKGFAEKVVSLGRDKLAYEEDGDEPAANASAGRNGWTISAGGDR